MQQHYATTNAIEPPMPAPGERRLRLAQVMEKSGFQKTKVYALIAAGDLPKPRKYGRASRWLETELDRALAKLDLAGTA